MDWLPILAARVVVAGVVGSRWHRNSFPRVASKDGPYGSVFKIEYSANSVLGVEPAEVHLSHHVHINFRDVLLSSVVVAANLVGLDFKAKARGVSPAFRPHISVIILNRSKEVMARVTTSRTVTVVKYALFAWVNSVIEVVRNSMRKERFIPRHGDFPVPFKSGSSLPYPAFFFTCDSDFTPKQRLLPFAKDRHRGTLGCIHLISLTDLVLGPCGVYETSRGSFHYSAGRA